MGGEEGRGQQRDDLMIYGSIGRCMGGQKHVVG